MFEIEKSRLKELLVNSQSQFSLNLNKTGAEAEEKAEKEKWEVQWKMNELRKNYEIQKLTIENETKNQKLS